jgi:flagellar biosynthesis protein FlhB
MDSVRSLLGDEESQGSTSKSIDFAQSCPSLSFKQRLWGFGICFVGGLAVGIIAAFLLFVNIVAFAVLYTIGNVLALGSTMFLVGPLRQFKNMFEGTRIIATCVFILSMGLTLFAAFFFKDHATQVILCLLFLIIQWAALIWYSLSYIPFARNIIKSCLKGICAD